MYSNFEETIAQNSLNAVIIGSLILIILASFSLFYKKSPPLLKKLLFFLITLTTLTVTVYLAASTIYLNKISHSKGPVHYHADLEIWQCGQQLNLKNPVGLLSNKIGTPTLHEHDDKRIHLEGVIVEEKDASLGKFFYAIGGTISSGFMLVPTTEGSRSYITGQNCSDKTTAGVQVFVYQVTGTNYIQKKIPDPESYIISSQSSVPPGDCIIIEFDQEKPRTDKLCQSFKVAKTLGELEEEKFQ